MSSSYGSRSSMRLLTNINIDILAPVSGLVHSLPISRHNMLREGLSTMVLISRSEVATLAEHFIGKSVRSGIWVCRVGMQKAPGLL